MMKDVKMESTARFVEFRKQISLEVCGALGLALPTLHRRVSICFHVSQASRFVRRPSAFERPGEFVYHATNRTAVLGKAAMFVQTWHMQCIHPHCADKQNSKISTEY